MHLASNQARRIRDQQRERTPERRRLAAPAKLANTQEEQCLQRTAPSLFLKGFSDWSALGRTGWIDATSQRCGCSKSTNASDGRMLQPRRESSPRLGLGRKKLPFLHVEL